MCTLTIIPGRDTRDYYIRMAFNRDESRQRPDARPPSVLHFGDRIALAPIDPQSGGTWIAASDAGVLLAVMNINPAEPFAPGSKSRGAIIPLLLACESFDAMLEKAAEFDPRDFSPFRLVLATLSRIATVEHHGGKSLRIFKSDLTSTQLFTSSGLGDERVSTRRRELFDYVLLPNPSAEAQDAFHRHQWADCPHLSVCMSRHDARTVSYTAITLTEAGIRMAYTADSPDQPIQPQLLSLPVAMEVHWK